MTDKNIPIYFDNGAVIRSPEEIANDPALSEARKIELLKEAKHHKNAPENKGVIKDDDLEGDQLLKLNSLANER